MKHVSVRLIVQKDVIRSMAAVERHRQCDGRSFEGGYSNSNSYYLAFFNQLLTTITVWAFICLVVTTAD